MSYNFQSIFQMNLMDLSDFHKRLCYFMKHNEIVDIDPIGTMIDIVNERVKETNAIDTKVIKIMIPINKKVLLNELKPVKVQFECCKVIKITATIWAIEKGFGLKALEIIMKEKEHKDDEFKDKHQRGLKIISIYKNIVYESYSHFKMTTAGPLHYNLMKQSNDKIVKTWCKNIFNNINNLFHEKNTNDSVEFLD